MGQIDFHTGVNDKSAYACRLVRKAYASGQKIVLYWSDLAALQALDQLLWSFSAIDFLPHVFSHDSLASVTPILLTHTETDTAHSQLLINLDQQIPAFFSRFARTIELVSDDPLDAAAGRARYKLYQAQGHTLSHHIIGAPPS